MVRSAVLGATLLALTTTPVISAAADDEGWISLFDGKTLEGWRVSENPDSAVVHDGEIVLMGPRAHVFYAGDVENHHFDDFELKLEVLTKPGANSGVYLHTEFQQEGWPAKGYEAQVNNSHSDWRRTGGLYGIEDVTESPVQDDEWWEYHLLVKGKQIVLKVNGETTVDYTEADDVERPEEMKGRLLSSGTIALQCHDPGSETHYRNIRVRPLTE